MAGIEVLLVTQQLAGVRSGVGTYARLLTAGLLERGCGVLVATWDTERDPDAFPGCRFVDLGRPSRLDPTPGAFLDLGRRFARHWRKNPRPVDVIHFLDARESYAFVVGGGGPRPRAVVGTAHDDYALNAPRSPRALARECADPWRRALYYAFLRRLEAVTYPRLDRLLVNSAATAASLARGYGLDPGRMLETRLTVGPSPRGEAQPLAGRPALLFVGGNWYRKGLDRAIEALALLRSSLPDPRLHVAGEDRRARRAILALARRLGVAERLHLHGRLPPAGTTELLRGADVLLQPARREALGLVFLEAFREGIPVVASGSGGCRELVRDRESGLFVPSGDPRALARAVLELERDLALRARLRAGGRRIHAERSTASLLQSTLAAYGVTVSSGAPDTGESDHGTPLAASRAATSLAPSAAAENLSS